MTANPANAAPRLFMGGIRPLPPDNRPTGIFKQELEMPAWLGRKGLVGDAQADRRVHGGLEKALHQYPASNYARLAELFPEVRELLVPGSIGENLTVPGWDEGNVSIGDRFRLGDAVVEVASPRSPCWKIDQRYGHEGMAAAIEAHGLTGWYFRVLEEGEVAPGCAFERIDRRAPEVTLARLLGLWRTHRPVPEELEMLAATPALAQRWSDKLRERAAKLRELAAG
jgi:MOSC domain-containing protein YiiM